MKPDNAIRSRGSSMIELLIVAVTLLLLTMLVSGMIVSGNEAHQYNARLGRVTEIAQEVADDMQEELRAVVRIFGNDAIGNAYRALPAGWPAAIPIASTTLPTIRPGEIFDKDTVGLEKTGNALLFARHAWADTFTCTSSNVYRVDVYRLVFYYMKIEGSGPEPKSPWGLNLCKWTSEPLVDGAQIDAIEDATDQAEFLQHLLTSSPDDEGSRHDRAEVVWTLGEDPTVAGTLRQIKADGTLSNAPIAPRTSPWRLERADNRSSAGLLFYRHHSVASNYAQENQGLVKLGLRDDAAGNGVGFPHGFEVQIVGQASARRILFHLLLVSTNMKGRKAYYDCQSILTVREG